MTRKTDTAQTAYAAATILREKVLAEQYGKGLKPFLRAAWPVIEPAHPFVDGWHIDCICDHVEAMCRREIRRLIINVPPRSTKSTIISIALPAWRWIERPQESFLCGSFSRGLAANFSQSTRALINSPWYQSRWRDKFKLVLDQNEKLNFANDKGGYRLAVSVESGGVLGRGGTFSIYDDPNDLYEMGSALYRQSVKDWYSGSAATRHMDPKTDVRLCVQQRAPYGDDLTSYLMELGGWEQVVIPNEFDGKRPIWPIGRCDPRVNLGELLCPDRMGPEETAQQKSDSKDRYAGLYQQCPVTDSGGIVKREWFRFYNPRDQKRVDEFGNVIPVHVIDKDGNRVAITPVDLPAAFEQVVQSWDMAFKNAEHNDYVAGHVWARLGSNTFLIHRDHGHYSFTESKAAVRRMSQQFPCPEKLVEDKANGTAIIDELRNEIPGLIEVDPYGGKLSRVQAISGYIEAGNVFLPNPDLFPWVWGILAEFADGAKAKHDDDRDAMSQALKRLYDSAARTGVPEFRIEPRLGEPNTACHVVREIIPPHWRRIVAVIPGHAAIWIAETPTGSLRVIRELDITGMDAARAGRETARHSLSDVYDRARSIRDVKRQAYEILMPKEAFANVEPLGSYAQMFESAILEFVPEDADWDARNAAKEAIREAHFRADMVEERDASLDRLRGLLAFQPPDFKQVPYNRTKAMALADSDMDAYADYMAAVEGEIRGEWPKIKMSPDCPQLIAELGSFRRDLDETPPFVSALLLAVCAPRQNKPREVTAKPWPQKPMSGRNGTLLNRRFAMRR